MVQIRLIIYEREERKFRITKQRLHALDIYAKLDELLVRNISHKVIKTLEYFTSFPVTTATFATLLYVISYLLNMYQEGIALL